jgi:hypothetical protein
LARSPFTRSTIFFSREANELSEDDGVEVDGVEDDGVELDGAELDGVEVEGAEVDGGRRGGVAGAALRCRQEEPGARA